ITSHSPARRNLFSREQFKFSRRHSERSKAKSRNPVALQCVSSRDVSTPLDMTTRLQKCFAARSRHWSRHFAMAALTFLLSKISSKHKSRRVSLGSSRSARPANHQRSPTKNGKKRSGL